MLPYQLRFHHALAFFIVALGCAAGSVFASGYFLAFLVVAAFLFLFISGATAWVIVFGYHTEKKTIEQDTERRNLEAVTRFAEVMGAKLPAQELMHTLAVAFPDLGFEGIYVPPETTMSREKDGFVISHELPVGLATDDQWARFASFYFGGYKTLAINQWTENERGTKVFTRAQYERILDEWYKAEMTRKLGNNEYEFWPVGEEWLKKKL